MDAKASRGWAVIREDGTIEVDTVTKTRILSIIALLELSLKLIEWREVPTEQIEQIFKHICDRVPGLRVAEVSIIEIRG